MLTNQEIRQLGLTEINKEITTASRSLMKIKMDLENGYNKEASQAKKLRRYIARLKTIKVEKLKQEQDNKK